MGCSSSKVANEPGNLSSKIVSELPRVLSNFDGKRFSLLWRGSQNGFTAQAFHSRCDGHANTLTIIQDTKGNIFGGYTPVKWSSPKSDEFQADATGSSFLFTVKNPHNVDPTKFPLKPEQKEFAIFCAANLGPAFGNGFDLSVSDNANTRTASFTHMFGWTYENTTGVGGKSPASTFFTGSGHYAVKEVEVFEVLD
jgi:hypothetical protein